MRHDQPLRLAAQDVGYPDVLIVGRGLAPVHVLHRIFQRLPGFALVPTAVLGCGKDEPIEVERDLRGIFV